MKILNSDNELFYLKAINIVGQGHNISLFFRQGAKYRISRSSDSIYYYKNVLLMLCFETTEESNRHFKILKDFYLNEEISVDTNGNNKIEFVGGNDYSVTVKSYSEQFIDQFQDDWIDRYLFLSKMVLDIDYRNESQYNLIKDIESMAKDFVDKNDEDKIANFGRNILSIINKNAELQSVNVEDNLLVEMNRRISELTNKFDSQKK